MTVRENQRSIEYHDNSLSLYEEETMDSQVSKPLLSDSGEDDKSLTHPLLREIHNTVSDSLTESIEENDDHDKDVDIGQFRFMRRSCMKLFLRSFVHMKHIESDNEGNSDISMESYEHIWINFNVLLILMTGLIVGALGSVWTQTITGAYLTQKTESDDMLSDDENDAAANASYIIGATSFLTTIVSFPMGYYLENLDDPIQYMKYLAKAMIFLSIICGIYLASLDVASADNNSNVTDDSSNYTYFAYLIEHINFSSLMLLFGGPCFTIYLHSLPPSNMSSWKGLARLYTSTFALQFIGPLFNIILYEAEGSTWSLDSIRKVMYVGLILNILTAYLILHFENDKLIEPLTKLVPQNNENPKRGSNHLQFDRENIEHAYYEQWNIYKVYSNLINWFPNRRDVSRLIVLATAFIGFGTGLSEGYFRRYFNDNTGISNIQVELVYLALPFLIIVGFFSSTKCSAYVGRVPCVLLFKMSGAMLMFMMGLFIDVAAQYTTHSGIPLYLFKSILLYGSVPIETSILVDFLEEHQFFVALSIYYSVSFSWEAAATLGDYLEESTSYGTVILFSAFMQTIGTLMYIPMLPIVARVDEQLS